ncbi:MAG: hypothetical protein EXR48_02515 [Dehalococcoidia bacterium]|nr:hypothetical protein [Dehalococcoidia bacterium]
MNQLFPRLHTPAGRAKAHRQSIRFRQAVAVLLALASVLLLVACGGVGIIDVERGKYVQGRTLTVGVTNLLKAPHLGYQDANGLHYVLRPQNPQANVLAVAKVTIANYRSTRVLMHIDTTAAYVDDDTNARYPVIDPNERRQESPSAVKDEDLFGKIPMWGSIELPQDFQVTGWMVFEIPKDRQVVRFGWEQGENIVVRFTEP